MGERSAERALVMWKWSSSDSLFLRQRDRASNLVRTHALAPIQSLSNSSLRVPDLGTSDVVPIP
jgi:hypothetical protein